VHRQQVEIEPGRSPIGSSGQAWEGDMAILDTRIDDVASRFGSGSNAGSTGQASPRRIDVHHAPEAHDHTVTTNWLLAPLGALAILGLGLLFWPIGARHAAPPVAQAPVVVPAPNAEPALAPPRLEFANDGGVARISGAVHDEAAKNEILEALKSVFGADKVQGDIAVDLNRAAAPWLVNFRNGIEALKIPGVQAIFDGDSVDIGGKVSDAELYRITDSMRSILGGNLVFGAWPTGWSVDDPRVQRWRLPRDSAPGG
jgi:hypothetical protein